jgi:hypothetical protein
MTENSAIFNARHGAGSFHPHRQLAPTAQDCLKRGNGANWRTTRQLSGECRNSAFLAALLFVRGLSSFQAAILLAERGMIQDARTITRSCFESVFCFGALRNDPSFLEKFQKGDVHGKKKFANALVAGGSQLEAEVAEKLSEFLNGLKQSDENGAPLKMEQAAKTAGQAMSMTRFTGVSPTMPPTPLSPR